MLLRCRGAMQLSLLEPNDLEAMVAHFRRQTDDNGANGVFHSPHPRGREVDADAVRLRRRDAWRRPPSETGWARTWALWHGDDVVGHAELFGGRLATEGHRARLGMGLEPEFRGRGNGRRLLETCVAWAREQPSLAWIDLGVFASNGRARALYESVGFTLVGVMTDRFRIEDQSIDDVSMTLDVQVAA